MDFEADLVNLKGVFIFELYEEEEFIEACTDMEEAKNGIKIDYRNLDNTYYKLQALVKPEHIKRFHENCLDGYSINRKLFFKIKIVPNGFEIKSIDTNCDLHDSFIDYRKIVEKHNKNNIFFDKLSDDDFMIVRKDLVEWLRKYETKSLTTILIKCLKNSHSCVKNLKLLIKNKSVQERLNLICKYVDENHTNERAKILIKSAYIYGLI